MRSSIASPSSPASSFRCGRRGRRGLGLLPAAALLAGCGEVEKDPDAAMSCAGIAGVIACNNFETEDPGWTKLETNGTATLDPTTAFTGEKALLATVAAVGGKAVRTRGIDMADRYYAKFFAKVPADSDTTGIALLHIGETSGQYLGTNVEISNGMLGAAVQSANLYDYPAAITRDKWLCLELDLVISETAGRVIVRSDGTTVLDRGAIDTKPVGAVGDLEVGISYAGAANTKVLIDDVVVAREPLPACK
jgi:hypothetical protein